MTKNIVFFDTEFTTWEGAMESNWGEDWQHREIVQIGAVRLDGNTLAEIDHCDIMIKPKINPELSDCFVNLTGITNEQVAVKGVEFIPGFQQFIDYLGPTDHRVCYGWDFKVFDENCEIHNCPEMMTHLENGQNMHPWFAAQGIDTSTVNSGHLAEHIGLEIDIHEHNALDDVRSMTMAFRELIQNRGATNPFLEAA